MFSSVRCQFRVLDPQPELRRACYWCAADFDLSLARSMSSFASNRNSLRRPVPRRQITVIAELTLNDMACCLALVPFASFPGERGGSTAGPSH